MQIYMVIYDLTVDFLALLGVLFDGELLIANLIENIRFSIGNHCFNMWLLCFLGRHTIPVQFCCIKKEPSLYKKRLCKELSALSQK